MGKEQLGWNIAHFHLRIFYFYFKKAIERKLMMGIRNKISATLFIFSMVFILLGCSTEEKDTIPAEISKLENLTVLPADIQPTHEITIQKDQVFGDIESEEVAMGRIRDVAVDDSGRVFISDVQQKTIHAFSADGQFLQHLGREGMGPGEFGHIFDMKIQGDRLFAFDPSFFRLNFYSLASLSFDHSEGLFFQDWSDLKQIQKASPVKFYDWGEGNLLVGFDQIQGSKIYYYILNNSNHSTKIISDSILVQKDDHLATLKVELPDGNTGLRSVPFGRKSLVAVSEDRHIFTAWTEQFLIKKYDSRGNYLQAWYYPYQKPILTRTQIDSIVNPTDEPRVDKALNEYEAPETWPALDDLRIDGRNRLWISTVVNNPSVTEWWMLEKDGTLVGRFTWPKEKQVEAIKNNRIYTREADNENGIQEVVRYIVEMKERDLN